MLKAPLTQHDRLSSSGGRWPEDQDKALAAIGASIGTPSSGRSPGRASPRALAALWGGLLAFSALAWTLTVRSWEEMGNGPGTMGLGLAGFVGFWTTMSAAMMLPAVAPMVSLYLPALQARPAGMGAVRVLALLAGYLSVWAAYGALVYFAAYGGARLVEERPGAGRWVALGILLLAGGYQLTPAKERCLVHCRTPLALLLDFDHSRMRLRDVRVGLYYGADCVGSCWALYALFVAVGVMNLAWMAALAAVIFVEKNWRYGNAVSRPVGAAVVVYACLIPFFPEFAPGLAPDAGMGAM